MIPQQTFESYDIFGSGATKVAPPAAKRSAGYQQADVLPAEWMNWAWYKNSKGINDLNEGATSMEAEIKTVLDNAGISPDGTQNDQLFKAIQKNNGCITTAAGTPTTITGAPALETGSVVRVMFGAVVTGSNTTTGLTISYNGSSKAVKVNKNGAKANFVATEVSTGTYKYLQAYTTLELVYDGVDFLIVGNPVVLSGSNYTVYADGKKGVDDAYPINAPYVQLPWTPAPATLFGLTKWTEITSNYAGGFFRAEGGNSGAFEEKQAEGLPNITGTFIVGKSGVADCQINNVAGCFSREGSTNALISGISASGSGQNSTCRFSARASNDIYGNSAHVTPENYAIKIWKRTA